MRQALQNVTGYLLTEGGLVRTLRVGCPEQTMHLWWTGVSTPTGPGAPGSLQGQCGQPEELLIEIELLRIEGSSAVVRINAPPQVDIVSAKKDPRCRGSVCQSPAG